MLEELSLTSNVPQLHIIYTAQHNSFPLLFCKATESQPYLKRRGHWHLSFGGILIYFHLYCRSSVVSLTCPLLMTETPSVWQRGGRSFPEPCHTVTHELLPPSPNTSTLKDGLTHRILIPHPLHTPLYTILCFPFYTKQPPHHPISIQLECLQSTLLASNKLGQTHLPPFFSSLHTATEWQNLSILFPIYSLLLRHRYIREEWIPPQGNTGCKDKWDCV